MHIAVPVQVVERVVIRGTNKICATLNMNPQEGTPGAGT